MANCIIDVKISQLTGALSHVVRKGSGPQRAIQCSHSAQLPIMIAVMTSKWVADSLYPDGIYMAWISLVRLQISSRIGSRF